MASKRIEVLNSFRRIKVLADARRLEILRTLMACPATLTQLSRVMRKSPAWVRHHLLILEAANFVEMCEIRQSGRLREKFYRARADALFLREVVLPKTRKPTVIFSGSHDCGIW